MEHKLVVAENELLEELVKEVQRRGMRGENGGWKEFLDSYDKKFGSSMSESDPSRRSRDVLVAFLATFKDADLKVLHCVANRLLIGKFKQISPESDTPEQSLVRLTVEHQLYVLDYSLNSSFLLGCSFNSYNEGWFISDVGMKMSKVMQSTNLIAIDCEMVLCEDGKEAVVRVGVVDRNLKVILDKFVKPHKRVVDYRTPITGVTAEDIKKATLSVLDIQEMLRPFLSMGSILVGHSLDHDLEVLKISHPRVIDTSLVFKFPIARRYRRPSLNTLCMSKLGYEVRKTGVSHNCVHDAEAAMKLVLALLEKRVDTTITLSKEMIEAEKSRLFLHRIPHNFPSEELNKVLSRKFLSKKFIIEVKPAKKQGGYYCAIVNFDSEVEANQAFENVNGYQEKDSSGFPQKLISCPSATFYVRKMD